MTDEEPTDRSGVVESVATALGDYWEALTVALAEISAFFEPNARAFIKRSENTYDPAQPVTVYVVSTGVLHRVTGLCDQRPSQVISESPSPASGITKCDCAAIPIMRDWTYSLSVTRTARDMIHTAEIDRLWIFKVGRFRQLEVKATSAYQQPQADPDPSVFAHALATEITRAQAPGGNS